MAIQDLTPQLRTRMGRVERAVGVFVLLAVLVLLAGFFYYLYYTAQRKGWLLAKAPYYSFVSTASGLKVGDGVKLMGFDVGWITRIAAEDPEIPYGVRVDFLIKSPYHTYIWTDSVVRVQADFLGNRHIEVTKGGLDDDQKSVVVYKALDDRLVEVWVDTARCYTNCTKHTPPYWLLSEESADVTEQVNRLIGQVEAALPQLLANATAATSNLNQVALGLRPAVSNANVILANLSQPKGALGEWLLPTNTHLQLDAALAASAISLSNLTVITSNLRQPNGSLGQWLLTTNLNTQLEQTLAGVNNTLASANNTLTNASVLMRHSDTNLAAIVANLGRSLDNVAALTGGLNTQVQSNTNLVKNLSDALKHTDELVQGLKRHWFLRSTFKENGTNAPPPPPTKLRSVKPQD